MLSSAAFCHCGQKAACVSLRSINRKFCVWYSSSRAHSHKGISPKRRGLRRGWLAAEQLVNTLATFALVALEHFSPTPCFDHGVTANPLDLKRGLSRSLFCCTLKRTSLLSRCSELMAKLSATFPKDWNCRLWGAAAPAKLLPVTYSSKREEKEASFRETKEGWPLLTVETEGIGDSKSKNERGPSLVGWLSFSCRYKRFLFRLGCTSRTSTKYIFPHHTVI
jgi:hypothetical protein